MEHLDYVYVFHGVARLVFAFRSPVSKVAPLYKLSVVFVLILAWPLLGEGLTWSKGCGGLLLTAGAIVLALAK